MKHLIKIETPEHGVLSVRHAGRDSQYSEAGETIILDWQPDPKWGLQEAHYTDEGGNVTAIDLTPQTIEGRKVVAFTMPDSAITIGATFKRFVIEDWTGKGAPFTIVGSYATDDLPDLNGMADAGKMAYNLTLKQYVVWNGEGWTDMSGNPVTPSSGNYLTFTAEEAGSSVGFVFVTNGYTLPEGKTAPKLQYSNDGGTTWQDYNVVTAESMDDAEPNLISLANVGDTVMFKGVNETLSLYLPDEDGYMYLKTVINGRVAAAGDVTSLLNGEGGDVQLAEYCYVFMFQDCTGLTEAPALPATTLAEYCYDSMFSGCTGLTEAPALPATTLATGCYNSMFSGCTGLTAAPALPATTLAAGCYASMFYGCVNITSHHVATLNNSSHVFLNNAACTSFTIDAETPPTIGSNTIAGLKSDCIIYVPAASVDAYKAAQYWSARAAYIRAGGDSPR